MKRWKIALGVIVVVVALVIGWAAYAHRLPWQLKNQSPEVPNIVTDKGGTYTFHDDMQVIVPKGAVRQEAKLSVSKPRELPFNESAPMSGLRLSAIKFDVSLVAHDGRKLQPSLPLVLKMPLIGAPQGNVGQVIALPYTSDDAGYALLPVTRDGEKLNISLPHLSPKYVTYVTDKALLDSFFPKKVEQNRGECKQEATVAGQKVKIGPNSRGWSLNDDSAIFACLHEGSEGFARVGIANRIDYILSVAATSDVRLAVSQGYHEEEVVKYVSTLFPFGDKIKAYVGRDGEAVGSINVNDLPATIELQGDFRTFAAESLVKLFGLAIGLLTGEGNAGKTLAILGKLLEGGELVTCLQNSIAPLTGEANVGQVVNAGAGCFGTLFGLLAGQIDIGKALWRVAWMGDALKTIVDTVISSANGIKLTLTNTLRVEVVSATPACPTDEQIAQAIRSSGELGPGGGTAAITSVGELVCESGWASNQVEARFEGLAPPNDVVGFSVVLHFVQGRWVLEGAGQDMTGSPVCNNAPKKVIDNVYCG